MVIKIGKFSIVAGFSHTEKGAKQFSLSLVRAESAWFETVALFAIFSFSNMPVLAGVTAGTLENGTHGYYLLNRFRGKWKLEYKPRKAV